MTDHLYHLGTQDRHRVNLAQYHEIHYWSEKLRCSPRELREAVARVGNSAEAVKRALQKRAASH